MLLLLFLFKALFKLYHKCNCEEIYFDNQNVLSLILSTPNLSTSFADFWNQHDTLYPYVIVLVHTHACIFMKSLQVCSVNDITKVHV